MEIKAPIFENLNIKKGDKVLITGTIYTARDAAHKRLFEEIKKQGKSFFETFPEDPIEAYNFLKKIRENDISSFESFVKDLKLPINLKGAVIFYAGPADTPPGRPIGAIGPTTSYRMDPFAPLFYLLGVKATIGKGKRSEIVKEAIKITKSAYFGAIGGVAAYLCSCVKEAKIIAYEDLGPEAIRELKVEKFPAFVACDPNGNYLNYW